MTSPNTALRWSQRFLLLPILAIAIVTSLLAVSLPANSEPADYEVDRSLFNDEFSRTVNNGLGTSTSGAQYATVNNGAEVAVLSGTAKISMDPGEGVVNSVSAITTADARAAVDVTIASLPTAGNGTSSTLALRATPTSSYAATMRITKSGSIAIKIERSVNRSTTTLLADQVVGKGAANTAYRFVFQVTGTNPVELAASAYPATGAAPPWQAKVNDDSTSRVTAAGYPQLNSYQSTVSSAATVFYDNLSVTSVAKTKQSDPPAAEPPISSSAVGSVPVGKANYPIPSGAIYVAPKGDSSGVGTLASPYGSLATALSKAGSGATIILRAGTYHESVEVPFNKALTIQNYPKEAVWLDGASPVSGWTRSGNSWYASGWNYKFDHSVSFTKGKDETSWWVNPSYPMAGYPDQVWINGTPLTQVGSAAQVTVGKFFVDQPNKRLVIGTDPSGKTVEASTLQKAITTHGAGTTLRGFGVKRYATTMSQMGAVSLEVANLTAENLIISDNATIGLVTWGNGLTINQVSLLRNGLMGGMMSSNNTEVTNSDMSFNNTELFNEKPVAGGVKVGQMSHAAFKNNLFEGNRGSNGLWFDSSSYDISVVGNTFIDNGLDGLEVELTDTARVLNNHAIGNASAGIRLFDTSHAEVWNNTVVGNRRYAIRLMQDSRRSGTKPVTFLTSSVNVRNNVVSFYSGNGCPLLLEDTTSTYTGAQLGVSFDSNAYYRASNSSTTNFACWAIGSAGIGSYKSLTAFQTATGNDKKSKDFTGTSILDANYRLTSSAVSATATVPAAVDSTTARLLGVSTGWRGLGAQEGPLSR